MKILETKNITKKYENNIVLDNLSFHLNKGEVLAITGDNGAGKSTLMKCITGSEKLSSGQLYYKEEEVINIIPSITREIGISMVYQSLNLCKQQTVWENIYLGREILKNKIILDKDKMIKNTSELLQKLKVNIKATDVVSNLSGGQQQAVAIAQSLISNPDILILDEPTSALSIKETNGVLEMIENLKYLEVSVIIISHRLSDVFRVADRVITLKQGQKILDTKISKTSIDEVTKLIIG